MNDTTIHLARLSQEMEARLQAGEARGSGALARIVLVRMPRHLATYQRLVRAAWALKRHQEGEDWARRLLQADPGNALRGARSPMRSSRRRCGTPRARCGSERLRRTPINLTSAPGLAAPVWTVPMQWHLTLLAWPASICAADVGRMQRPPIGH